MTSAKPKALEVRARHIPDGLKAVPGWVMWRWWWNGKKWTKPPYDVEGVKIDQTDPENWADYSTALQAYQRGGFDGIGFSLGAMDSLGGVDLDHCVKDGEIEPWALEIVEELGGYAEISPSGGGLRVLGFGKLRREGRKKDDIEMYDGGRYLTVTGHKLDESTCRYSPAHMGRIRFCACSLVIVYKKGGFGVSNRNDLHPHERTYFV